MFTVFHDFDQTIARINAFRWETDERTERAVTQILIDVERYALPMIPIATGNLANSASRETYRTGSGFDGRITYGGGPGAEGDYAAYVHEAPGTLMGLDVPRWPKRLGFVWDPSGEPEFLRKAIDRVYRRGLSEWLSRQYA